MSLLTLISRPGPLFTLALLLRLTLFFYGLFQDAHSPVKYTDIDYLVFTDASRFVANHSSPYDRETYRYTPLLAWLLLPTATWFFSFGKLVFAAADLLAGWLLARILIDGSPRMEAGRAYRFAAIWLLNPMVATISTRGSSEGLLGVLTAALLWAVCKRRVVLAAVVLGVGVHFKIYPFIYAPASVWWMDDERMGRAVPNRAGQSLFMRILHFINPDRVKFAIISFATFMGLNFLMYSMYGTPFIIHTYLHHVSRIDHRHNFSPYNILLYLSSSRPASSTPNPLAIESLAFLPQLLLSAVLIPLVVAKQNLATSMMAQTFAFVTFNKVCTSQYFLWYLIFLPLYLPSSTFLSTPSLGLSALAAWILPQAIWLQQAYQLEFLGLPTFTPGLWGASLAFFLVNCWILGIVIWDGAVGPNTAGQRIKKA
ncbi:GPI mannosyltransferase 1 [Scedosporium apiospermum]|uniref:GPI mannosyltransferase 1 n=1 Tax=Pseudallescheria apiosperma TaxID=563466 RepID=A0A084G2A3_PSEDA|nr:GPI mannosyltransferase 1 [Scedosporium apiospermum]KEZ41465.1 GPI mannosyltransferase 1 [Scedosporium apiospermum]